MIRSARPEDVDAAVNTLVRAFDSDPPMNWIMRKDERRVEAFGRFFRMFYQNLQPHGESLLDDDMRGVCLWAPPGKWKSRWYQNLIDFPNWARIIGWRRIGEVINATDAIALHHPSEPHYYLFAIGVDPAHQGRGLGRSLMKPMLDRCDREGALAYLEASKESNIPVYRSMGFDVTGEVRLGNDGPPLFPMRRAPR